MNHQNASATRKAGSQKMPQTADYSLYNTKNSMNGSEYFDNATIFSPSVPQSECSTLINFSAEVRVEAEDNDEISGDHLNFDNAAWMPANYNPQSYRKPEQRVRPARTAARTPMIKSTCPTEDRMIEPEDRAWGHPTSRTQNTKFKAFSFFKSSTKAPTGPSRRGLEPEYIDVEDRAWM